MACPGKTIAGCDFAQYLVDQQPVYDKLILEDIRPTDSWILNVKTGTFEAYSGVQHTLDRFTSVFPDTTKVWSRTPGNTGCADTTFGCTGNPCDPKEYCITWGSERKTYYLEQQSWATTLLCFDQEMHVTHAREHLRQIISNVLKPATSAIMSNFLRKRAMTHTDPANCWVANATTAPFTFTFNLGPLGDEEIFFDCSIPPNQIFLLTPQMLQRRVHRLWGEGYNGKNPFKDMAPLIELVSDIDTCWSLDRLGGTNGIVPAGMGPSVVANWRFEQWGETSKYWRYGFTGQIGNFAVRVDPMGLRFNYLRDLGVGNPVAANRYRYQIILPYVNVVTNGAGAAPGLQSKWNPHYDTADFGISFIWHKSAMEALVADATPVNPEMPFSSRNFGGRWQFVLDNLGADCNGLPIENKRRNKGQFIADFKLAIRPLYTELMETILHKRELPCVYEISPCKSSLSYPAEDYNSCVCPCDGVCTNQTCTDGQSVDANGHAI